ncbi:hypothetical protein AB0P21_09345 [Kribbella sp. NPDC056861]|uniref:hypothetical protein n=1 Tax=Kribbella sp. NPDC056861 TaxID=3154857 RepID=UPI003424FF0D
MIANSARMVPLLLIAVPALLTIGAQSASGDETPPAEPVLVSSSPSQAVSPTPTETPPGTPSATPPTSTPPTTPPGTPSTTPTVSTTPSVTPTPSASYLPKRPTHPAVSWPSSTPSATPSVAAFTTAPVQREKPAEAPPSVVVPGETYLPSPPELPAATSGGEQVEGVALARSSASGLSLGMLGGIFLASGGVLMAAAAMLNLRRRGKHSG